MAFFSKSNMNCAKMLKIVNKESAGNLWEMFGFLEATDQLLARRNFLPWTCREKGEEKYS